MPHTRKHKRYPPKSEWRARRREKMVGRMSYIRGRLDKMGVQIVEETLDYFVVMYRTEKLYFYPWTGYFQCKGGLTGKYAENFFALLEEEQKRKNY